MIALDTNVLLYACDRGDPKRQQIAIDLIADSRDGVLLWQVACEFVAASRKLSAQGFTVSDAWSRLAEFLNLFPLNPPDGRGIGAWPTVAGQLWRVLLGCPDPRCLHRGWRINPLF